MVDVQLSEMRIPWAQGTHDDTVEGWQCTYFPLLSQVWAESTHDLHPTILVRNRRGEIKCQPSILKSVSIATQ